MQNQLVPRGSSRMHREKYKKIYFSRRDFLKTISCTPVLFLPDTFHVSPLFGSTHRSVVALFSDLRLTPRYPSKSPLDELLGKITPGNDDFVSEKYAYEIIEILSNWNTQLTGNSPANTLLANFVDEFAEATSLRPSEVTTVRRGEPIQIVRRAFPTSLVRGRDHFLADMQNYLSSLGRIETAEFLVTGIDVRSDGGTLSADIRYDFVGQVRDFTREQRVGNWKTWWRRDASQNWRITRWEAS